MKTITAEEMRKKSIQGKQRVEKDRRSAAQAEETRLNKIRAWAKEQAREKDYPECIKDIKRAANNGRTETEFTISEQGQDNKTIAVAKGLAIKAWLENAGFRVRGSGVREVYSNMGDFAAPCHVWYACNILHISWDKNK